MYLGILGKNPPPLYVLEIPVLKEKADHFKMAFKDVLPDVAFYYAVKSNNHPDVSRALVKFGFGLDVSSSLELEMALGLDAGDIVFSGPGKTKEELALAAGNSGRTVVLLDSFGELTRLESVAAMNNTTVRTGVRLTNNPAGLWRKFGILLSDLPDFW
ncbi:MAG TPA: decarboxylase, partial [Desulfobacteraceae bacterium]|nr:decarboxylase [Desulfobacteraceae bacterium]